MATRGAKPKPAHLRIVDGTHRNTRHGGLDAAKELVGSAVQSFGPLQKPKGLRGESLAAWRKYIEPAGWLDGSREPAAIAFCELWSEFRANPLGFAAAKHGQMRAYMAELGLTDERNRLADDGGEKDEFLD